MNTGSLVVNAGDQQIALRGITGYLGPVKAPTGKELTIARRVG